MAVKLYMASSDNKLHLIAITISSEGKAKSVCATDHNLRWPIFALDHILVRLSLVRVLQEHRRDVLFESEQGAAWKVGPRLQTALSSCQKYLKWEEKEDECKCLDGFFFPTSITLCLYNNAADDFFAEPSDTTSVKDDPT